MNNWETILLELQKRFYIEIIMWIVELMAIILGFLYVRRQILGKLFLIYLIVDFAILHIGFYLQYFIKRPFLTSSFINHTNTLISLIELIIYYHYFKIVIENPKTKVLINTLTIVYISVVLLFVTNNFKFISTNFSYLSYLISATGFAFLLFPCVSYFFELMTKNSSESLLEKPSFWIVTGVFFYSIISIPYYLLDNLLNTNRSTYRIMLSAIFFYFPFTLNFLFLIKAFLCRKPLQT